MSIKSQEITPEGQTTDAEIPAKSVKEAARLRVGMNAGKHCNGYDHKKDDP